MKKYLLSFFALIVILILSLIAILNSTAGSIWLLNKFHKQFDYQSFQGALLKDFTINECHIHSPDQDILIDKIHLHWQPQELLALAIKLNTLEISGVQIHLFKTEETSVTKNQLDITLPSYLRSIEVQNLHIAKIYFHRKQQRFAVDDFKSNIFLQAQKIAINFDLKKFTLLKDVQSDDNFQLSLLGEIQGSLQHFIWSLNVAPNHLAPWHLNGEGSHSHLSLTNIQNPWWPKQLALKATYQWFPMTQINLHLQGMIDPSIWSKQYSGELALNLSAMVVSLSDWRLNLDQLQGQLQGRKITGQGAIDFSNQHLSWKDWHIQIAQSHMILNGALGKNSSLMWDIDIPNLTHWLPKATGSITSHGEAQGDFFSPSLQMSTKVAQLKIFALGIDSLLAQANIVSEQQKFMLSIVGKNISYKNEVFNKISIQSNGATLKHDIQIFLSHSLTQLSLTLQGGWQNQQWQGTLKKILLQPTSSSSAWSLKQPVNLMAERNLFSMNNPLCLQQGANSICAKLNWNDRDKSLDLKTSSLDLKLAQTFFPANFSLSQGQVQLNTHVYLDKHLHPFGQLNIKLSPIVADYQINRDHTVPIQIKAANWQANFVEDHPALATGALDSNLGSVKLSMALPQWQKYLEDSDWKTQPLTGQLSMNLTDISLLEAFVPTLQNISGKLEASGTVSGALNAPKVKVHASLHQGKANYVPFNLDLNDVNLNLDGWLDQSLKLSGRGRAKEGVLFIEGDFSRLFTDPKIFLHLTGKNALAADLPSYQIWMDPDLNLMYQTANMKLYGKIFIPKARLNFGDFGKTVVTLTPDVVYVGEERSNFNFFSNIALSLGNDVSLRYGGLKGNLIGSLNITQASDTDATAVGSIHLVQGTYAAYGQTLTIEKAAVIYRGDDVANPTLNVKAVKIIKNAMPLNPDGSMMQGLQWSGPDNTLTVGVSITGPLIQRRVLLFSDPAGLSQSDILSYLVLGVPPGQAGAASGQILFSAASALGGGQGDGAISTLQEQLKNTFGLDVSLGNVSQYDAASQSMAQGTALILTKTLSPKLFLTYSAGVGQVANQLKVRYQITPSWMAQTESSTLGNGADIYYTIDRY